MVVGVWWPVEYHGERGYGSTAPLGLTFDDTPSDFISVLTMPSTSTVVYSRIERILSPTFSRELWDDGA